MNTADIKRLAHVRRWQIVRTTHDQSLAEHLALVAHYALDVQRETVRPEHVRLNIADVLQWALYHDIPEVHTGDISTPAKAAMGPEGKNGLHKLERDLAGEDYEIQLGRAEAHPYAVPLVRFCDSFEAYVWLSQHGLGTHARKVQNVLIDQTANLFLAYYQRLQDHNLCRLDPDHHAPSGADWFHNYLKEALR